MRNTFVVAGVLSLWFDAGVAQPNPAPIEWPTRPPLAVARPVTEVYFGTALIDPYRYMETPGETETLAWMREQGEHTRAVLDAIPARTGYLERLGALSGSFGIVRGYTEVGGRAFYLERPAGGDVFNLMVRESDGRVRTLVDVAVRHALTGTPHAIDYYQPSPDGTWVAVGVSKGGNENADLTVLDVSSGAQLAGPVANARYASPSFTPAGGLAFTLSQTLRPGQPSTETFLNRRVVLWDFDGEPIPIAGATVGAGPPMRPDELPRVYFAPGSSTAVMGVYEGVRNELDVYVAPASEAARPGARWRKVADRADGVTALDVRGDTLFLLSNHGAPTFRLLAMPVSGSAASATEVIPARPERVLERVATAADATYVGAREGVYGKLLRVPAVGGPAEEIALPIRGTIGQISADPREPGAVLVIEGWTAPPTLYRYDHTTRRLAELPSGTRPPMDSARYETHDLRARARDGVEVPLSVIAAAGPRRPRPLLLSAYGSYGISQLPAFSPSRLALIDAGATSAVCHVRGGGELGEMWRLGGKDQSKPNTWRDLIACAEYLIGQNWTTAGYLAISGGSAGGITVGRAMIERPELFAAVISLVPVASAVRSEFQKNGPVNTVEFGTVSDPQGFRNLLAMDAYFTIEDGHTYPAVMFTTGLNDTRVDSWQPAKATARMQAAGSPNPVLLRVEADVGHGSGATRPQSDGLAADIAAFLFWRTGLPEWQPRAGKLSRANEVMPRGSTSDAGKPR